MITQDNLDTLVRNSGKVYDSTGAKVGSIGQIYLDDGTSAPSWITVNTGLFGTTESFVPLEEARMEGNDVHVAHTKDHIKDAPRIEADGNLTPEEENRLYEYYALGSGADGRAQAERSTGRQNRGDQAVSTGDRRDNANGDQSMTRSEERLVVGTETHEAGRVRLRKHVVTEDVTKTVPVSHEEVVIEREPITDANRHGQNFDIAAEEQEVTLHEEQVLVGKETVPVEEVKLSTKNVTGEETVKEQVRKEKIDTPKVSGQ
ncbi:YsnF/AvaK domain-containing protein [Paeniglutamicibacter antarcticus]|uniref:PRC and DUF2382 domain-containing protein n=1 Tax=Paeniglutamicibacter antarcticus TaxID=494023 RepID=A0ABP9TQS8_9MICC